VGRFLLIQYSQNQFPNFPRSNSYFLKIEDEDEHEDEEDNATAKRMVMATAIAFRIAFLEHSTANPNKSRMAYYRLMVWLVIKRSNQ
jgi:hypothetical protein